MLSGPLDLLTLMVESAFWTLDTEMKNLSGISSTGIGSGQHEVGARSLAMLEKARLMKLASAGPLKISFPCSMLIDGLLLDIPESDLTSFHQLCGEA